MMDASAKSFEENVDLTSQVVEYSHKHGVSVEAEIGHVGTAVEGSYLMKDDARAHLTQPEEAKKFVELTKTDCLAVAIGTVHGEYKGEPHLDFEVLEMIDKLVSVPLVIHGGSGTGDDNIRKAVSLGIRKINVFHDWITPAQAKTAETSPPRPKRLARSLTRPATSFMMFSVIGLKLLRQSIRDNFFKTFKKRLQFQQPLFIH